MLTIAISSTICPILTKVGLITQKVSLKDMTVKKFNFKNPIWRTSAILKIENSRYFMMMQNGSLKCSGRPPCWIVSIRLLTAGAFEIRSASLCRIFWRSGILLPRCHDFSRFFSEMYKFVRWSRLIRHNFVKITANWEQSFVTLRIHKQKIRVQNFS